MRIFHNLRNKRKNKNWEKQLCLLLNLLKRGCSDSDIEDFINENPNINAKAIWDFVYEYNAPECCKGCNHIQMIGFEPCNSCSRRVVTKDNYEPR